MQTARLGAYHVAGGVAVLMFTAIIAGCGGGGGFSATPVPAGSASTPSASASPSPTPAAASTPVPATISGVIQTANFMLPAGQTTTATAPVVIVASGTVQIDGSLIAQPGATIAVFANSLIVNGSVGSMSSARRIDGGRMVKGNLVKPGNTSDVYSITQADINGTITSASGRNIDLTALVSQVPTRISVSGSIRAGDGIDGLAPNAAFDGYQAQDGGSINIGTSLAIMHAIERLNVIGAPANNALTPISPQTFNVIGSGSLFAGAGGQGLCDSSGLLGPDLRDPSPAILSYAGGPGGNGGSININAGQITGSSYTGAFKGGSGGLGGSAGGCYAARGTAPFAATTTTSALDGTVQSPNGLNVYAVGGAGGNGGGVHASCFTPGCSSTYLSPFQVAGAGGLPGGFQLRAGNGFAGAGGTGGSTFITFGALGQPGAADSGVIPPYGNFGPFVNLTGGGNGGTGAPGKAGGAGGTIQITYPFSTPSFSNTLVINLALYGNGGTGGSGCPATPGGPGGPGGKWIVSGIDPSFLKMSNSASGSGGVGGTGTPPGMGGISFFPGLAASASGATCSGVPGPAPSPTPTPIYVTPRPPYGDVLLFPNVLTFAFPGDTQFVQASQDGNQTNSFFSTSIQCPNSGSGSIVQTSPGNFKVTALTTSSGQTCTSTITGRGSRSAVLRMTF